MKRARINDADTLSPGALPVEAPLLPSSAWSTRMSNSHSDSNPATTTAVEITPPILAQEDTSCPSSTHLAHLHSRQPTGEDKDEDDRYGSGTAETMDLDLAEVGGNFIDENA